MINYFNEVITSCLDLKLHLHTNDFSNKKIYLFNFFNIKNLKCIQDLNRVTLS